jgi:hypothetical protein
VRGAGWIVSTIGGANRATPLKDREREVLVCPALAGWALITNSVQRPCFSLYLAANWMRPSGFAGCHHSDDEKAKSFRCLMRAIVIVESLFLLAQVYANEAGNG